jgi:spore coat polysaccharide biosynthesis protein SpsF
MTNIIVQIRLDSSRLPNKALAKIWQDVTLIELLVKRLHKCKLVDKVIIATTEDSIETLQKLMPNENFFVGDKANVLKRYYDCAKQSKSSIIVRATGDNCLVDFRYIDKAIIHHIKTNADLTHFVGLPYGCGVEVISFGSLEKVHRSFKKAYDVEHVTPGFYKHRDSFLVEEPIVDEEDYCPSARVSIDMPNDLEYVRDCVNYCFNHKKILPENVQIKDIINFYEFDLGIKTTY